MQVEEKRLASTGLFGLRVDDFRYFDFRRDGLFHAAQFSERVEQFDEFAYVFESPFHSPHSFTVSLSKPIAAAALAAMKSARSRTDSGFP